MTVTNGFFRLADVAQCFCSPVTLELDAENNSILSLAGKTK
tara:strand:+ start:151 stop:273 length:123 start_codon:yes stop_codon:yes gene_type:complete